MQKLRSVLYLIILLELAIILFPVQMIALAEGTFEMFFFNEDSAHTTGDSGYQLLGVINRIATTTPAGHGDYSAFSLNPYGWVRVEEYAASTTAVSLEDLDIDYDGTPFEATSTVFRTDGMRQCSFKFSVTSTGTGGHLIRYIYFMYNPVTGIYHAHDSGSWARQVFDDTSTVLRQDVSIPFPASDTGYGVIHASTTAVTGSLFFTQDNSWIHCRS